LSSQPEPSLSVVIAATDSIEAVAETLASLGRQTACDPFEILIVAADDRLRRPEVVPEGVDWVSAEAGSTVPMLRRLGLDRARGDVVILTEDSCRFDERWASSWVVAFSDDSVLAATGPVEPAMGGRPIDWAVFFCEYAPFLPGRGSAPMSARRLAGNNFAVRRTLASGLDPIAVEECEVPDAVARLSGSIRTALGAKAYHARRYPLRDAFRDRLKFGLSFGRHRGSTASLMGRLLGVVSGPAILVLQVGWLTGTILTKGRYLWPFLSVLPLTVALLTVWSVGEWLGRVGVAFQSRSSRRRRERAGRPLGRPTDRHASRRLRYRGARPHA
jgi:hypothetical protein